MQRRNLRRREFLVSSFFGAVAFSHSSFATEAAAEPSAFYFDNPYFEGETSVLGEIGRLFVHEGQIFCQPGEFRDFSAGLYRKTFAEAKDLVDAKKALNVTYKNKVIASDAQGQLIITATLDDNSKWLLKLDREVEKEIRKKYAKNDRDQFGAYQIEHAIGVQGKKYLTIDPVKQTLEWEESMGKKVKVVAQRVILTDKSADRQFVWYNDYSGR